MLNFEKDREVLENEFNNIRWIEETGISETELLKEYNIIMNSNMPKAIKKASLFEMISNKSRIAVDKKDIFQDKLFGGNLIKRQRNKWFSEIVTENLKDEYKEVTDGWNKYGSLNAQEDFGHTSPNSELLVKVGFSGLLSRIETASKRNNLSEEQKVFYEACRITISSIITVAKRLAEAIKPYNEKNSIALKNIAENAPQNIYEVMQLLILYFFVHEYVYGTRVRTLGRLDVLLYPFYKKDIKEDRYTKQEIKNMLKYFLLKFWSAKVPFDLPFCLGGIDKDDNEVTNELSYLIVETYNELNIYSPKIHIRVSEKTPKDFILKILSYIRGGNSSFVFVNDYVGIKSLEDVGIEPADAKNYVPIGCYEPAVWGVEIGCTGNGGINLAKAVELVICNGRDNETGEKIGVETGKITCFDEFKEAVKKQIKYLTDEALDYISKIEGYYKEINPDSILSAMYDHSIETGKDVYEGGAKYNNSSLYFYCLASLVDSIAAVKKLVYDDKEVTFDELCNILKNNWEGYENLRLKAKNTCPKYGTNNEFADRITVEISNFVSDISNNYPNGRGGVFKAALISIDYYVHVGERTMATPDGRLKGEILSKNLCASFGMDKNGITALINSVTKMDLSKFPNGSVLDIVLHPSAVSGYDGLEAFYIILKTYFKKGGFAMHSNVFNAETLKKAQSNPEKYKNLQVRVCGWNAYFVNLSKAEQDGFIKQSEGLR